MQAHALTCGVGAVEWKGEGGRYQIVTTVVSFGWEKCGGKGGKNRGALMLNVISIDDVPMNKTIEGLMVTGTMMKPPKSRDPLALTYTSCFRSIRTIVSSRYLNLGLAQSLSTGTLSRRDGYETRSIHHPLTPLRIVAVAVAVNEQLRVDQPQLTTARQL